MLSTVFSGRNLLRKQFSYKLHIKQKLCTSFALLLSVPHYCYEKYFFPALTGIRRQPDVSSAFLMFRLGSGRVLGAHVTPVPTSDFLLSCCCLGSDVQTTGFPLSVFFYFIFFHSFHLRYQNPCVQLAVLLLSEVQPAMKIVIPF